MNTILQWLNENWSVVALLLVYVTVLVQLPLMLRVFLRRRRAIYRKVAIIGPPRAGKTTLITAMLDRVLNASNLPKIHFQERSGISEYASNIRALQRGSALPETSTDRFFIYKFDYASPIPLPRFLKTILRWYFPSPAFEEIVHVEMADFAGDYSNALASLAVADNNEGATVADSTVAALTVGDTFLDWVRNSDAMLFLVDGNLLAENDLDALGELISNYKAIWLHIGRTHTDLADARTKLRVAIAITKVDLVSGLISDAIEINSFPTKAPIAAADILRISKLPPSVGALLQDLHNFLQKNAMQSEGLHGGPQLLLTSAIGRTNVERLGIDRTLDICLM